MVPTTTDAPLDAPDSFSALQASRLTGASPSQIRYWSRVGLVVPSSRAGSSRRRYRFRDLVALRMVRSLLDAGLSLQRVRKAVEHLDTIGDDLTDLRLVSDGSTVFACRDDGEVLDALRHGQLALFVSVDAVASEVEAEVRQFSNERRAFVDSLQDDARSDESGEAGG